MARFLQREMARPSQALRFDRPLQKRSRRGIIMILSLWLVVVLSLIAISLAYEMRMEMVLTAQRRDGLRALELARLGLARVIADLRNDQVMDHVPDIKVANQIAQFDGPGDVWNNPKEYIDVEVEEDELYSIRVIDEESKIQLNSANAQHVSLLKNLLRILGESDREAEKIAQTVWDWMDPDDLPFGGEGESELVYYNEIHARENGGRWNEDSAAVRPINDRFVTLEQLLLVPGITPQLYYGYDPADPDAVEKYEEAVERGRDVPLGLRDCLSVVSRPTINVNTASFEVLAAVFATIKGSNLSDGENIAEQVMDAVGSRRGRKDNDKAARSLNELVQALGPSGQDVNQANSLVHALGVSSTTFLVNAEGKVLDRKDQPKATKRIEAMLCRAYQPFTVNDERKDNRERNFRNDEFKNYMRRNRKNLEDKIGKIEVPLVYCYWWSEN